MTNSLPTTIPEEQPQEEQESQIPDPVDTQVPEDTNSEAEDLEEVSEVSNGIEETTEPLVVEVIPENPPQESPVSEVVTDIQE